MRAIHHIAAECQTTQGAEYHIVYGVEVGIGALEARGGLISARYLQARAARTLLRTGDTDVPEGVMIELVAERLALSAGGDVYVALALRLKTFVREYMVGILHAHLSAGGHVARTESQPTREHAPHIDEPRAVGGLGDRHRAHGADDGVALAHLRRGLHARYSHLCHTIPRAAVERLGAHVGRNDATVHTLTAKLQGVPRAGVGIAARRCGPGGISACYGVPALAIHLVDVCPHERTSVNSAERGGLIPSLPRPYHDVGFRCSGKQAWSYVIGDDERAAVELRDCRREHAVVHLAPVDVQLMIAQRVDMGEYGSAGRHFYLLADEWRAHVAVAFGHANEASGESAECSHAEARHPAPCRNHAVLVP